MSQFLVVSVLPLAGWSGRAFCVEGGVFSAYDCKWHIRRRQRGKIDQALLEYVVSWSLRLLGSGCIHPFSMTVFPLRGLCPLVTKVVNLCLP